MKKLSLILALCVLASAAVGCAGKMVFEKDKKLYHIKDDGTDLAGPILASPVPAPVEGDKYGYPDVSNNGEKLALGITADSTSTSR